ncbi:helicase-associated domain-containing protein [Prauserella muralis]|uniref:DNA-binding protein n=1 Tax=Prauserella muralis TaxID=588067 RepID=A0A2V4BB68_9PSEU|nr:helicase-associated domain-containing protein [Prauserella muralis]PXY32624.1 DNA-binding protein [Prauserella muralis]TWE14740.1 XPB/Ssl2-like helicase family protein [Prauserella muralis]
MAATSLADWLRSASDDLLTELLRARRDLATPPPADSGVLATRAGTAGSIARACENLDTATLAVLEALLVAGADTEPVGRQRIAGLLGADLPEQLDRLRGLALAWGEDDALSVAPGAREVFGPYPAGLGAPAPGLDEKDLDAALAEAGEDERALLGTLAAGPPIGRTRDAAAAVTLASASTPVQRLLARGLLLRRDDQTVELPQQLGLALRGGHVHPPEHLSEPELPTNPHQQSTVDATAAGEAMEFLRRLEALLRLWSAQPSPVLKSGGLGVREVRRLGRELDADDTRVTLLAELAFGAGLVAASEDSSPEWVPTTLTDSWLSSPPSGRWLVVAQSWLDLPRLPGLAGQKDVRDRTLAPLSEDLRRPLAPAARRRVLDTLAELPSGAGVKGVEELVRLLAWRAPRRGGRLRDDMVRWAMAEASAIGVVALGALTSASGALLGDDPHGAASAMAEAMPQPVDQVLVQADLTVVAPGPLEPELAADVEAVADVESAGHATVYRVTEASVRRALDTGRTAGELQELFRSRSATPVPQALEYLIDDVARRHGRLRGGVAAAFLRCDDEVLVAEVLGNQVAREFELRRIAPTVLVSPYPLAELLDGLRAAGFAPAAEGPDGRIMDLRPSGRRIPARRPPARAATGGLPAISAEQLRAVLTHVRAGDRAATTRRGTTVRLPAGGGADTSATLALLSQATREQREVWIGFVDAHGTASQRVVTPVRVGGGILESSDNERYPLHRITSAALVED